MFRFLIVEDNEDLLEELSHGFSRWFPDSKIETAESIEEGLQRIRDANSNGWFYDAAVLDFKLPDQIGLDPKVDDALCREVREAKHRTLVIHFTGYPHDWAVVKHLRTFHQEQGDSLSLLIVKSDLNWLNNIKSKTLAHLYGNMIDDP